jgi:hypothetical protein
MELGRRNDDANRAVPISLFFTYFAKQNERERREYYFIGSARGNIWRVQIVWPNGSVHYFGRFSSKKGAHEWIISHAWLTAPIIKKNPPRKDNPTAESGD